MIVRRPPVCRHNDLPLRCTCQHISSCPVVAWPNPFYYLGVLGGLPVGLGVHGNAPFSSSTPQIPFLLSCQTTLSFRLQPVIAVIQSFLPHQDPFWKKVCLFVEMPIPASLQAQSDGGLLFTQCVYLKTKLMMPYHRWAPNRNSST